MSVSKDSKPKRGIYLLPNLFTTAALFAGFYAIVAAMKGLFDNAAIAIFVAMILDSLDGRVARLTNTQSEFGAEYDSISDMVSFAIAPALVVYSWGLSVLGKVGWLAAFIYTACTALRLARFNTQASATAKKYFQGMPCPAAAAVIAGLVWMIYELGLSGGKYSYLALIVTLVCAVLMVSNIRYHSFKQIDLRGKVPFVTVIIIVLMFVFISIDPPQVLFAGFSLYALSGPVFTIYIWRKVKAKRKHLNNK